MDTESIIRLITGKMCCDSEALALIENFVEDVPAPFHHDHFIHVLLIKCVNLLQYKLCNIVNPTISSMHWPCLALNIKLLSYCRSSDKWINLSHTSFKLDILCGCMYTVTTSTKLPVDSFSSCCLAFMQVGVQLLHHWAAHQKATGWETLGHQATIHRYNIYNFALHWTLQHSTKLWCYSLKLSQFYGVWLFWVCLGSAWGMMQRFRFFFCCLLFCTFFFLWKLSWKWRVCKIL